MRDTKVISLFGFIGSGKSTILKSLQHDNKYNIISKEDVGFQHFLKNEKTSQEEYLRLIKQALQKDNLFLVKLCVPFFDQNKINVIDSINTPHEYNFLSKNNNLLSVGVWREKSLRMQAILHGRQKTVTCNEPTSHDSFFDLDKQTAKYMQEGLSLFNTANIILVNDGSSEKLVNDFLTKTSQL